MRVMQRWFRLSEIDEVAAGLLAFAPSATVFAFHGGLGAGKTTLVARLCRRCGVNTPVSSPTFSLVNEYPLPDGGSIHHIDLYRLRDDQEAFVCPPNLAAFRAELDERLSQHGAALDAVLDAGQ